MKILFWALSLIALYGQEPAQAPTLDFICPTDPDVRGAAPGQCPRCGMKLKVGVPDPVDYAFLINRLHGPGGRSAQLCDNNATHLRSQ